MNMTHVISVCLLAVLLTLGGCVRPGHIDQTDVYALQQSILQHQPQDRGAEGLGLMRPSSPGIPALAVKRDAQDQAVIDLSLEDAITRALANNSDIGVVSYNPAISRQQMIQAASEFDTTLEGSFAYDFTDSARNHRLGNTAAFPQKSTDKQFSLGVRKKTITGAEFSASTSFVRSWDDATTDEAARWYQQDLALSVTQPLLRGAWPEVNLASLRIARLEHSISLSEFRAQVEATLRTTINLYYQLIQARQEVVIAEGLLKVTEETFERVKGRGPIDATIVQIKQAEAAVQTRRATLVQARKNLADTQDALARQLNDSQINLLDNATLIPTTELADRPVEIDLADQLLTALRLNPSLEQARLAIQQAEINVKVAEWNRLPELNFTAGANFNGASRKNAGHAWNDVTSGRFMDYNIQLTFSYPLGNRQREAELAESRLTRMQAITGMQNTANQLAETIRERIRQVRSQYEQVIIQRQALAAAKAQLGGLNDLEQIRGQLTPEFLNLKLNAQASVAQAERAVIAALVQYNTAMVDLAQATGSVLELHKVKLALPVVEKIPATNQQATRLLEKTAAIDGN